MTAKTLLRNTPTHEFSVTVFEKAENIGGIWGPIKDSTDGFLNANTPTNLSKFTVCFSDLNWENVDLSLDGASTNGHATNGNTKKEACSLQKTAHPRAWQVRRYLETYIDKFGLRDSIRLNAKVIKADRVVTTGGAERWEVHCTNTHTKETNSQTFDRLVIASGFFSEPGKLSANADASLFQQKTVPQIIHSSQYRSLTHLLPTEHLKSKDGGNIVVIGGANSSSEMSATLAYQLSAAANAPQSDVLNNYKIVHVTARPLYSLPLFLPSQSGGFEPLDLRIYNLSTRPPGDIKGKWGRMPEEGAKGMHKLLRSAVGDQTDLGAPALVALEEQLTDPPYIAVSEFYAEYVRSGSVLPKAGRVTSISASEKLQDESAPHSAKKTLDVTYRAPSGEEEVIEDVVGVVYATGYSPSASLSILPPAYLDAMQYDPACPRLPILLRDLQTYSPAAPDLAFIGFFENPFWGTMEMQARLVAKRFTDGPNFQVSEPFEDGMEINATRSAMKERDVRVPQTWIADYCGYLEQTARTLDLENNDGSFTKRQGPAIPSRYLSPAMQSLDGAKVDNDASATVQQLYDTLQAISADNTALYTARAAFRALQGRWHLRREILNAQSDAASNNFEGVATFLPRDPTAPGYDFEHLYEERSKSDLSDVHRFVYRYRELDDTLSVWSVEAGGGNTNSNETTVDCLYHDLVFQGNAIKGERKSGAVAIGRCSGEQVTHENVYEFCFKGISLSEWGLRSEVKSPCKDYVNQTWYER